MKFCKFILCDYCMPQNAILVIFNNVAIKRLQSFVRNKYSSSSILRCFVSKNQIFHAINHRVYMRMPRDYLNNSACLD